MAMETTLSWLVIGAVAATAVVLVVGVIAMLRGGAGNAGKSNRLMRARIAVQFAAVVLIALAFLFGRE